jgi:Protein of unknown function (DUF2950)
VVKGKMIGGFALVAWPAEYGVSGVQTFIVDHEGLVYGKDLGTSSVALVRAMTRFNPDKSWTRMDLECIQNLWRDSSGLLPEPGIHRHISGTRDSGEGINQAIPITTLFLDIGGILLTDAWGREMNSYRDSQV